MDHKSISRKIALAIDDWVRAEFPSDFRDHLGASLIGRKCDRELWYGFRWVAKPTYRKKDPETGVDFDNEPSMKRLFQRGHSEEDRLLAFVRGIGATVLERDPETGDQLRIVDVDGHFGGSLDAEATMPVDFGGVKVVVELKTYGQKAWDYLQKEGIAKAKPEHMTQMDVYGCKRGIAWGLYIAVNKNTDELFVLFRPLDVQNGRMMIERARRIILAVVPPERIDRDPTRYGSPCRFCDFKAICHEGKPATERNCRSCKNAQAAVDGEWYCGAFKMIVPHDAIPVAPRTCPQFSDITAVTR